jgi:hypothetical protein
MRFMIMVLVPPSTESEAGALPDQKAFEEMDRFNEELVRAGVLLTYEGLHPASKGARLRISGGELTVIDGPFTESKEMIAGYMLIQAKSKEEAIAWMKRAPFSGEGTIELRQVMDLADFAPLDPTGELRTKEVELRKIMASTQLNAYLSTTD